MPPPSYGGTEAVVDRLARGLVAAGHEVLLYAAADSTCPVPQVPHPRVAQPEEMGQVTVELAHVMAGHAALTDCDIVHDHTVAGPVVGVATGAPPLVMTAHGPFEHDLSVVYGRFADRVPIIAISHNQADSARRLGIPIAAVIHHGLDVDEVPVGRGDGGYLLFLGRMTEDKGADAAVEAARAAGVPLKIAAKMREPAELEWFDAVLKPKLGDDIEYVGEADLAAKTELLQGALALVNPIRWAEPFGLVMVEALSAGTPVLAFPNGSAPEIVEDGVTGFLCADVEEMAQRVGEVGRLDRAACRRAAETRFSTARVVADHVALYERVLAGTVSPTPQFPVQAQPEARAEAP